VSNLFSVFNNNVAWKDDEVTSRDGLLSFRSVIAVPECFVRSRILWNSAVCATRVGCPSSGHVPPMDDISYQLDNSHCASHAHDFFWNSPVL
jgi:hypothetical protein